MQRVHFIAIGGIIMHNLAIATSKKNSFVVTGSDVNIDDYVLSALKLSSISVDKKGWYPDRIHKGLSAVIVGSEVQANNIELVRAKELGLKIYSLPEFIYQQTRSKTRIVIAGSSGKAEIVSMIIFVLKQLRIETDYYFENSAPNNLSLIKLSYESRIAVLEGDENFTSELTKKPKFLFYKPQIVVLTGIDQTKSINYPTQDEYIEQFDQFIESMEVQGRLIINKNDEILSSITQKLRRDIVPFNYNVPEFENRDGIFYLKTKKRDIELKISGELNLQYMEAARLACKQIGVTDDQFYNAIENFRFN